jgi:hypothetical protein
LQGRCKHYHSKFDIQWRQGGGQQKRELNSWGFSEWGTWEGKCSFSDLNLIVSTAPCSTVILGIPGLQRKSEIGIYLDLGARKEV